MADCKICNIINKKIEAKIVYEDAAVMAILSDEPTIFGHLLVFPKQHNLTLEEVDDKVVTQLFYVASYAATAIFEGLGAEGTNIIICNGKNSSQKYDHIVIDVLPRKTNDGLDFKWEPKKLSPEEMDTTMGKIKDKADVMNYQGEDKPKTESKEETDPTSLNEDNYIVRHLRRIP
ncbi:HIT family protein [Candidatus Woesearchaeota archaeon]|jgi:histidine triad (HIT) family protein|nr:HIT family protein [Candidatus Woesearchaeota archaeon]